MLTQTATIVQHTSSGADSEGNPTFSPQTTATYPCRLEQIQTDGASTAASREMVTGEARTDTSLLLFLPAAAEGVKFEDEVIIDGVGPLTTEAGVALITESIETISVIEGVHYQIEGQPIVMRAPRGTHHIEARLRRVSS